MKPRENSKYALVIPTSMGIRITPENRQPISGAGRWIMQSTSAESNVGNVSAALGLPVKLLTKFVKDSEISEFIKGDLRRRGLDFEGLDIPQGGPWGYRHQFNIADGGFGPRGPRVQNDRAGEVGRTMSAEDFDLERIFEKEGAGIVHMSGLIAALSAQTGRLCAKIARIAKKSGSLISFDLNHRASFWEGRESELSEIFSEIASLSDILIGNEEDYQLALGLEGPPAGGSGISGKIDGFKNMIGRAAERYPNTRVFVTTLREVLDANTHEWGSVMYCGGKWHVINPRPIAVYDRIGGGDGFVGGLLYGISKGWEQERWPEFAWATGAMAASVETDYCMPQNEEQVWAIFRGNARVKR